MTSTGLVSSTDWKAGAHRPGEGQPCPICPVPPAWGPLSWARLGVSFQKSRIGLAVALASGSSLSLTGSAGAWC